MNIINKEPEPKLKYERIGNDMPNILGKDHLSCFTLHDKFMAIGTVWGLIYIVDHNGNKIITRDISAHSSTVNQISIDRSGEFIGSCSHDGRVLITGLYSSEHSHLQRFDSDVKCIALNPYYSKSSSKLFVAGVDKLLLYEKTIIGKKSSILYAGGFGQILNVKWDGNYIVWNDIKVYDAESNCTIGSINREMYGGSQFIQYRCCLKWYEGGSRRLSTLFTNSASSSVDGDNSLSGSLVSDDGGVKNRVSTTTTLSSSVLDRSSNKPIISSGVRTSVGGKSLMITSDCPKILVIGWADQIKICKILISSTSSPPVTHNLQSPRPSVASTISSPKIGSMLASMLIDNLSLTLTHTTVKYVQIYMTFTTHFYICGIMLYPPNTDNLTVLAYPKDNNNMETVSNNINNPGDDDDKTAINNANSGITSVGIVSGEEVSEFPVNTTPKSTKREDVRYNRPQIHIISPKSDKLYEESVNDALSTKDWQITSPTHYFLEHSPDEETFFIATPKDIILARNRTAQDHVQWLLEKQDYEGAFTATLGILGKSIIVHPPPTTKTIATMKLSTNLPPPTTSSFRFGMELDQISQALIHTYKVGKIYVDNLISKDLYRLASLTVIKPYYRFPFTLPPAEDPQKRHYLEEIVLEENQMASIKTLLIEIWTDAVYKFAKSRRLLDLLLPETTDLGITNNNDISCISLNFNLPPLLVGAEDGNLKIVLEPKCYHLVFGDLLGLLHQETHHTNGTKLPMEINRGDQIFYQLIKKLPINVYDVNLVINLLLDRLKSDKENHFLAKSLALLYSHTGNYSYALGLYLKFVDVEEVFDLLIRHDLSQEIMKDPLICTKLIQLDESKTLDVLLLYIGKIPVEYIVEKYEKDLPHFVLKYLHAIYQKDEGIAKDFHDLQVKLYAEYDPKNLMPFLKGSHHYSLQKALATCRARELFPELHYLYAKAGNLRKALSVLVINLQDIFGAIDFCKEQDDPDLWSELINLSVDNPEFVTVLLENIGTFINPLILIQNIKAGMKIKGLRDALVKILRDYQLQTIIQENCNKILLADSASLFTEKYDMSNKPFTLIEDIDYADLLNVERKTDKTIINKNSAMLPETKVRCCHCHHSIFHDPPPLSSKTPELMKNESPVDNNNYPKRSKDDLALQKNPAKNINSKMLETVDECSMPFHTKDRRLPNDIVIYFCKHAFHSECLRQNYNNSSSCITSPKSKTNCPVCSTISQSFKLATTTITNKLQK